MAERRFSADSDLTMVTVLGANRRLCVDCGHDSTTEEELTNTVRLGLAQRFGDRVIVEYHSVLDPATVAQHGVLLEQARASGIPLPLVVVDGAIVQGGGIDFKAIVNAVDLKSERDES